MKTRRVQIGRRAATRFLFSVASAPWTGPKMYTSPHGRRAVLPTIQAPGLFFALLDAAAAIDEPLAIRRACFRGATGSSGGPLRFAPESPLEGDGFELSVP